MARLSNALFWDVERGSVDPEAHADFLIIRIVERGTREDVSAAWAYYGESRIKGSLLTAPSLSRKTIAFFANQFGLSREAFRAYNRAQCWSQ